MAATSTGIRGYATCTVVGCGGEEFAAEVGGPGASSSRSAVKNSRNRAYCTDNLNVGTARLVMQVIAHNVRHCGGKSATTA
ncbi:hypothetical protein ACQP0C_21160 [Nocardia sp. CA-129566]|uniref:hypothetical protein n=1 Tax=Nocardia sp. CA-129566 TaxID=3239976 RepID=UPI003D97B081